MAKIVAPLTKLTGKEVPYEIGADQRAAMKRVNEMLALHTVMQYPDYAAAATGERPFVLVTDASKVGFGAVLSQSDAAGVEQPRAIAFASRATLANEKNWLRRTWRRAPSCMASRSSGTFFGARPSSYTPTTAPFCSWSR
jgi:RNase H-like domain found in reverse transcriptase